MDINQKLNMAIDTLYFSTQNFDWNNHPSKLLTSKNLEKVLANDKLEDYHTSIEDLQSQNLHRVCKNSNELKLVNIDLKSIKSEQFFSVGRLFNECFKHPKSNLEDFLSQLEIENFSESTARTMDSRVFLHSRCRCKKQSTMGIPFIRHVRIARNYFVKVWCFNTMGRESNTTGRHENWRHFSLGYNYVGKS
jgi:hypothetical protein